MNSVFVNFRCLILNIKMSTKGFAGVGNIVGIIVLEII
jgi:hypothetical protein